MITNRDPKLGTSSYDIERKVIDLEAFTGSKTKAPMDIYVDGDDGDDSNTGTQAEPLATITEAESRIPDIVNHLVKVWVQPASADYAAPYFRPRLYRQNLWVVGGQGDNDWHFSEILAATSLQAGSDSKQLVTSGGLGSNTYQGRTVEILDGPRAGDLRRIRDHDDTTITLTNALGSGDAPNTGDTFRVVEPAVTLTPTSVWHRLGGAITEPSLDGGSTNTRREAGLGFFNVGFGTMGVVSSDVSLFGCDFSVLIFTNTRAFIGGDGSAVIGYNNVSEADFGAGDNAFRGWGVFQTSSSGSTLYGCHIYGKGIVVPTWNLRRTLVRMEGGSVTSGGLRVFFDTSVKLESDKPPPGDIDVLINRAGGGADAAVDVRELTAVAKLRGVTVTSDVIGVQAIYGGICEVRSTVNATGVGLLAHLRGKITFSSALSVTSGTADTRVIDAGVNTDQALGGYGADGDYIAAGDGSVIQRGVNTI